MQQPSELSYSSAAASTAAASMAKAMVAASVAPHVQAFQDSLESLQKRTAAMRERERAKDAASIVAEMEVIDLHADLRQGRAEEMAKSAAAVVVEMDLIDAQRQNEVLACENDRLQSAVRFASSAYVVGMPFSHSLAHCLAHLRTAITAARSDLRWTIKRKRSQAKDAVKHFLFVNFIQRMRLAIRASRQLAAWKAANAEVAIKSAWLLASQQPTPAAPPADGELAQKPAREEKMSFSIPA